MRTKILKNYKLNLCVILVNMRQRIGKEEKRNDRSGGGTKQLLRKGMI